MSDEPLPAVCDGRNLVSGRFSRGNSFARGNAAPRRVAAFRAALFNCIRQADFREIVQALVTAAKAGEPWAVKECLRYLCGSSADVELHQRLLVLETHLTKSER
jgi:hypothetical protein